MARISIITPTLGKRPAWLADAAESLSKQTLKPVEWLVISPCEIPLPDSGCPTRLFCGEVNFAKACNIGHTEAKAEYIAYLADDDLKGPEFCEHMLRYMSNADAIMCVQDTIDEKGTVIGTHNPTPLEYAWQVAHPWNALLLNALLVRTPVARAAGFDERMNAAEDYDYILRLLKSHRVVRTTETLACYRKHPGQLSNDPEAAGETTHQAMHIAIENHPQIIGCGRCEFGWKK